MKKISPSFLALLILLIQVVFSDIIIYFTGLMYIIANVIGLTLNIGLIVLFIRKKWIKIEHDFCKWDIIFLAIMVVVTATTIIFPDEFWDTYSYHLYFLP